MSLAALAALAVLAVVTLLARRTLASPILGRLRALIPSWRLFDRAMASPQLLVRFGDAELGAWTALEARDVRVRAWTRWAFSPAGNLALAYQALVEQLVAELGELELEADATTADAPLAIETDPQVTGLVSYALVARVARAHVPAGARFQWKVVVPGAPAPIDYLLSPVTA